MDIDNSKANVLIPDMIALADQSDKNPVLVFGDEQQQVLLFHFPPREGLEEHATPHPASLQIIQGLAKVTLGAEEVEGKTGIWVHMPPKLPHSIIAIEETYFLLTISK